MQSKCDGSWRVDPCVLSQKITQFVNLTLILWNICWLCALKKHIKIKKNNRSLERLKHDVKHATFCQKCFYSNVHPKSLNHGRNQGTTVTLPFFAFVFAIIIAYEVISHGPLKTFLQWQQSCSLGSRIKGRPSKCQYICRYTIGVQLVKSCIKKAFTWFRVRIIHLTALITYSFKVSKYIFFIILIQSLFLFSIAFHTNLIFLVKKPFWLWFVNAGNFWSASTTRRMCESKETITWSGCDQ